tara:strand:- start:497 stop:700 length:204 start_codon:yes stop_codon:yes gene_type:complete
MSFASGCIVLNFIHLKLILFLPILSCKKNIGPLELSFISKEIIRKKGKEAIKKNIANKKSRRFLNNL